MEVMQKNVETNDVQRLKVPYKKPKIRAKKWESHRKRKEENKETQAEEAKEGEGEKGQEEERRGE